MSTAISVYHGKFGRACLYQMNRRMVTHAHREGHLTFLVQGEPATQLISDRIYDISRESACAINPWEPHDFRPMDEDRGALFLILYIKPIWFLEVGRSATSALRFGRTQVEITDTICRSVHKVANLLLDSYTTDLFDGYLYELTQECFDQTWQWQPSPQPLGSTPSVFTDFRVRKSIRYMTDSLGGEIQLDAVARESGLSRPHFYKLFRQQTGITPNLFLNTLRMERAIDDLTQTDKSVTDISGDLGFSSQSGFTRFFCANVGMAPTDYRRVAHVLHA
ncbi:MAG: helix-turn-helix domain-containing protein [Methyloligellaceae bacterium]